MLIVAFNDFATLNTLKFFNLSLSFWRPFCLHRNKFMMPYVADRLRSSSHCQNVQHCFFYFYFMMRALLRTAWVGRPGTMRVFDLTLLVVFLETMCPVLVNFPQRVPLLISLVLVDRILALFGLFAGASEPRSRSGVLDTGSRFLFIHPGC